MNHRPTSRRLLIVALLLGPTVAVRSAAVQAAVRAPAPATANPKSPGVIPLFRPEEPPCRSLDVNLFAQTSADFRDCCLEAYNLARLRLAAAISASTEPPGRLAVVLDLHETVIDNGVFQTMMICSRLAYDQRLWDIWEAEHWDKGGLVPGAKEFILETRAAGVTVIYVSNRNARFHEQTRPGLERLDLHGLSR